VRLARVGSADIKVAWSLSAITKREASHDWVERKNCACPGYFARCVKCGSVVLANFGRSAATQENTIDPWSGGDDPRGLSEARAALCTWIEKDIMAEAADRAGLEQSGGSSCSAMWHSLSVKAYSSPGTGT